MAIPTLQHYRYAAPGSRTRKIGSQQQVRYLPGLELYIASSQCCFHTDLRIITTSNMQILQGIQGVQPRFNVTDRSQSLMLELNHSGEILSRECYDPFGGTTLWASHNQGHCAKTRRYGGKQRDASGLLFYGWRYYAPWLMRWLNPDPAQTVDGLNLYAMVSNNPSTHADVDGRMKSQGGDPLPVNSGEKLAQRVTTTDEVNAEPANRRENTHLAVNAGCLHQETDQTHQPLTGSAMFSTTLTDMPREILRKIAALLPAATRKNMFNTSQYLRDTLVSPMQLIINEADKTQRVVGFTQKLWLDSAGIAPFLVAWEIHKEKSTDLVREGVVFKAAAEILFPHSRIAGTQEQRKVFNSELGLCRLNADGSTLIPYFPPDYKDDCLKRDFCFDWFRLDIMTYKNATGKKPQYSISRLDVKWPKSTYSQQ